MMDDSSLIQVPMPIDVFGYDIGAIMLEKRDFMDFIDSKEISGTCNVVYIKCAINVYSFLGIK